MTNATWIVTANAGRARIFAQEDVSEPLHEVNGLINNAVRLRTTDTESDALGQMSASKGRAGNGGAVQPNGYEPHQSPAEHQTELFARSVADFLLRARYEDCFKRLCIMAAPEFLGVLRKVLDANLQALVVTEINRDYTQLDALALRQKIREHRYKH
ncbi:MAG: host attachment protein [Rhodocyclaceae bacterium]|nr:host attachment protein [Rhodocyclaceae bacterium]